MNIPKDLKYTKEHEWVKIEGDVATIGITDYAQGELGDIVFVELPAVGDEVKQMEPFGTIEAVKAVSELFSPLSGTVKEINEDLEGDAAIINTDPYGAGWMLKIENVPESEVQALLDAAAYGKLIED
ncbi:MAG: glycine cleavage system protein GcvH [candidate division Zixibacteria bacterium]|nr:glycine cleavage system protein GcvH [candidate division Zixibacteria bacterium]